MTQNAASLKWAPTELSDDREFLLEAVARNAQALVYVPISAKPTSMMRWVKSPFPSQL